ncbi:ABC transporter ATP-binding protein [Hydrogenophaga sp.]|uniref:ABC transporter ATP-binding protein n=1 Tax=Hydrogenophaga sp. TaxID=1904254 RepID=UPI00271822EB|nr:ABC transporter ATP-binding protein [Hydrogenophaga sp.]MDO9436265.1 ABC transporter ATP-binding protein [Hydrogenophaga sp.]
MNLETSRASPAGVTVPEPAGSLLHVKNLSVSFRDHRGWTQVLDDVSLTVNPGEAVGVVGESGSGKSVTSLAIMGLLPERQARRSGQILFQGQDLVQLPESAMRKIRGRRIGMVFQEPMSALDPVFTIGDQIGEAIRAHFGGLNRAEVEERTLDALASVGIPSPRTHAASYPMSLSGGMRQRVTIAMALVCEPALLIADEPTTALDVTIQAQIMDILLELTRKTSTAVMFITHNVGLVAQSCSRMVTMYAGHVMESAPVVQSMSHPLHPYTAGLLACVPGSTPRKSLLPSIPGRVPSPDAMPTGCRFGPRCTHAIERCHSRQELKAVGGSSVRCCRHGELQLSGVGL